MIIVNRLRSARVRLRDEGFSNIGSEIDLMEEAADLIERIQDEEAEACAEIADEFRLQTEAERRVERRRRGTNWASHQTANLIVNAIRGRIADRKAAQNP